MKAAAIRVYRRAPRYPRKPAVSDGRRLVPLALWRGAVLLFMVFPGSPFGRGGPSGLVCCIGGGLCSLAACCRQVTRLPFLVYFFPSPFLGCGVKPHRRRDAGAAELGERVRVRGARAATFTPHVARIHPAKLVRAWPASSSHSGCRSTSTRRCCEIGPHEARHARGSGPRALGGAGDRGLHRVAAGPAPRAGAGQQLDDRHRAAARRGLVADRLVRRGADGRRGARVRVPAAHGRRADRDRGPRRALPLRLSHRRRRADRRAHRAPR